MAGSFKVVAAALAVVLVGAGAALAAGGGAKLKAGLNYQSLPYCDGSGYFQTGTPGYGTVKYAYKASSNTVSANVTLTHATPNHTFYVRLTQGSSDCYTDDGTLTTNASGTGKAKFKEQAVSSFAYIWICAKPSDTCGANDEYYGSNKIFTHGGTFAAPVRSAATPARSG